MGLFPAGCLRLTGKPLERDGPPSAPWQMEGFLLSSALREERASALLDPAQSQNLPGSFPAGANGDTPRALGFQTLQLGAESRDSARHPEDSVPHGQDGFSGCG